jgi:fatty acid desaturase
MKDLERRKRVVRQIQQIKNSRKPNLLITCLTALSKLGLLIGMVCFAAAVPWALFFSPVFMLLAVPLLRALENLGGHEGAHENWIRNKQGLNDRVANLLAAWWVVSSAESFRARHDDHHCHFGEAPDPCFTRFSMFHFAQIKSWRNFLAALRREYLPYLREYWEGYANVKAPLLATSLGLHALLMLIGTWLLPGFWIWWLVIVIIPFLLLLPVFRMLAESQEHNYDGSDELTDSHSNLTLFSRLYLHPVGDAYHKLHHVHYRIPHFRMRSVHLKLMDMSPEYRDSHKKQTEGVSK